MRKFRRVVRASSWSPVAVLLFVLTGSLSAQLFDNLEAFGKRLDVGDPDTPSGWFDREGPKGIATADFDADGRPDFATSNLDGTLTLYLAAADGSFASPRHLRTGFQTLRASIAADVDRDGLPELIGAGPLDDAIAIFANAGNGAFAPARILTTGRFTRNLVAGDFDGDERTDLVVAGPPYGLRLLKGDGAGGFAAVAEYSALRTGEESTRPVYSLAAYRPGDETRDLVAAASAATSQVLVLRHDGAAELTLLSASTFSHREYGQIFPHDMVIGELSSAAGGGAVDLVAAFRWPGVVLVLESDPTQRAFVAESTFALEIPGAPRDVEIVDLDGDGWNDLVVVLRGLDRVLTYRNDQGTLVPSHEMPVGRSPRQAVVADFTGDGDPDLAVINRVSADVSILESYPGQVGFGASDQFYLVDGEVSDLAVADLDGDGLADVLQLHRAAGEVSIRRSEAGTLAAPRFYPIGEQPNDLQVLDVNRDGALDVLAAGMGRGEAGTIGLRLGDGAGDLRDLQTISLPEGAAGGLFALEAADLDGDGILDLAAGYFDCRLGLFRGAADGSYRLTSVQDFLPESRAMVAGDFDQDGDVDLAGAGYQGDVVVVENRGDLLRGAPLLRTDYPTPSSDKFGTKSMEAIDLDEDGDLDLLVGSGGGLMVYRGEDGISFRLAEETLPGTAFPIAGLVLGDFDGDGRDDAALSCKVFSCITVLTQAANGSLLPALTVDVPSGGFLAAGDVDGDGHLDLVGSGDALWTALSGRRAAVGEPPRWSGERVIATTPVINELLAANNAVPLALDEDRTVDWVEIFYGGSGDVALGGWKLTFSRSEPLVEEREFVFPPEAALASGEHLVVVYANGNRSPLHTGFKLPREGGRLVLARADGFVVDTVDYGPQRENASFGRYLDGTAMFSFNPYPSPGARNVDNGPLPPEVEVVVAGAEDVRLETTPRAPRPGEPVRLIARASDDVGIVSVVAHYQRLDEPSARVDRAFLFDDGRHGDGAMLDGIFSAVVPGLPAGGAYRFLLEAEDLSGATSIAEAVDPDDDEGDGSFFTLAVAGGAPALEISEVVPRNDSGLRDESGGTPDWAEVRNCSGAPVPLAGVFLGRQYPAREGWFAFPADLVLPAGGYAIVYCDGASAQGAMHAPFNLEIERDRLVLVRETAGGAHELLDAVDFGGMLADQALARENCGGRWITAVPSPGGATTVLPGDADLSGVVEITDAIVILGHLFLGGPLACAAVADTNGDGRLDVSDAVQLLNYLLLGGRPPAARGGCD